MNQEEISDLIRRAEEDDIDSQNELAARFATGDGIEKNQELAIHWYKKAAAQESFEAKYNLAMMYFFGEGVEKNIEKAKILLNDAACNGSSDACLVLGEAFELGNINCTIDYLIAARYYIEAIRLGSTKGIRCIGDLLIENKVDQKQLGILMKKYQLGDLPTLARRAD